MTTEVPRECVMKGQSVGLGGQCLPISNLCLVSWGKSRKQQAII